MKDTRFEGPKNGLADGKEMGELRRAKIGNLFPQQFNAIPHLRVNHVLGLLIESVTQSLRQVVIHLLLCGGQIQNHDVGEQVRKRC